jgi:hypothetical protein
MKSLVVKRSIVVAGHKTNVTLEDAFWNGMKEIARGRNITLWNWLARSIPSTGMAICHRPSDNKLADVQAGGDGPRGDFAIRAEAVMPPGCDIPPTPMTGAKQEGRGQVALFLF